jgi:hypothetical protein
MLMLALAAVLAVSCANVRPEPPPAPVVSPAGDEAEFGRALDLLAGGQRAEARLILDRLVREGEPPGLRPRAYFYLGISRLYEMQGPADLEGLKRYFDAYREKYPLGPDQENAASISRGLGACVSQQETDQARMQALSRRLKDQEQLIHTLQDQIRQLEQVHRESEQERQSL